jgi:hypothetical protein
VGKWEFPIMVNSHKWYRRIRDRAKAIIATQRGTAYNKFVDGAPSQRIE